LNSRLTSTLEQIAILEEENGKLRTGFQTTIERMKNFHSDEHLIDRRLVVKLLLTYFLFEHNPTKKEEMLLLMYKMLGFSEEDRQRIAQNRQQSSLGGQLKRLASYLPSLTPFDSSSTFVPSADAEKHSLADLWVEFLIKEATKPSENVDHTISSIPTSVPTAAEAQQPPTPTPNSLGSSIANSNPER
jgi:hypothetical protein